ncbi:phage major capsid protein [Thauera chlorobenzoica]|uniref:Phage capsid and scaffold n=1 Tax=Thauera chlorobenzoica TaxID=96773 RepID=A0A1H5Z2Z1_9RHOO|nr:phage major capsid protein [Thauera chlorobenzoica]APR05836.1 Phage capsid and scaffold [Thauera chlorobenzoica]SEG30873.1 phage major capsid protein, HK97 family [Thauera chlorobenzoica]
MTAPVSILAKGTQFARLAICLGRARGEGLPAALQIAEATYGAHSQVATVLRAAVGAGTTDDSQFAAPLVEAQIIANDFLEATRTRSVLSKLDLRRVPTKVAVPVQTGRATAYWAGHGAPKPLSKGSLDTATLEPRKVVGIVPLSRDLVRLSNGTAEALVRRDLVNGAAALADSSFLDPTNVGVAGVQPASITAGLTPVASSGNVTTDLEALIDAYAGDLETAAFITDPLSAVKIGLRSSGSNAVVVGARGGEAVGIPVFTSSGSPRSTSGGQIVLLDQTAVLMADEGIRLDVSEQAALQFDDAPSAGAQALVSLWQNNLVAFLIERRLNWAAPLAGTVVVLNGALY